MAISAVNRPLPMLGPVGGRNRLRIVSENDRVARPSRLVASSCSRSRGSNQYLPHMWGRNGSSLGHGWATGNDTLALVMLVNALIAHDKIHTACKYAIEQDCWLYCCPVSSSMSSKR